MSSQPSKQASTEKEEEDFYDCEETLGPSDRRGGSGEEEEKEDTWEDFHIKTDNRTSTRVRLQEGQQDKQQGDRLQEKQQDEQKGDRLQDNSDSEMKESSKEEEFDDDYLREVQRELTGEEKEVQPSLGYLAVEVKSGSQFIFVFQSLRQQSLTLKEKGNGQFKAGSE